MFMQPNPTITKGVFIDEVDVSGMTAKEAEEAIDKYFNELKKQLTVMVDNSRVTTTLDELGYSYKIIGVIEEALKVVPVVISLKDIRDEDIAMAE